MPRGAAPPLVQVHLGLLARNVAEAAADALDRGEGVTLTLPSRLVLSTRRMCWKLLSFIMSDIFAASQSFRRPRSGDAARLVASGQGARAGGHRDGAPGSLSFLSVVSDCYSK